MALHVTNDVIRENLLDNSGFGVWSNSTLAGFEDSNTGFSNLEDNGEDWTGASGSTPPDGWTVGTDGVFNILADSGPDGTGDSCLEIEVNATPDADPYIYDSFTTEVGKLYRVTFYFKHVDGTNGKVMLGTTAGGSEIKLWDNLTDAAWTQYSYVFEATTTTVYISLQTISSTAGQSELFDTITLSEVTPACVGADSKGPDGWRKGPTNEHRLYREHDGANTKDGSFYAIKVITTTTTSRTLAWPNDERQSLADHYRRFAGRTVTFGAWVKTSTASYARLVIYDGVLTQYSSYHTGSGTYEWLEVTKTVDSSVTIFYVGLETVGSASTAYISQPMLVFGSSIGEGNAKTKSNETIYFEKKVDSQSLDNSTGKSDVTVTTMNVEADSYGAIPKGAKAVRVLIEVNDSGSATTDCYFIAGSDISDLDAEAVCSPAGLAADMKARRAIWIPCNSDGDFEYQISATGSGTFDITKFQYIGVQLR